MSERRIFDRQEPIEERLNPWLTLWYRPSETFQWLFGQKLDVTYYVLVAAYGVIRTADRFVKNDLADQFGFQLGSTWIFILLIGPLIGYINVLFYGWVFGWSARVVSGSENYDYAQRVFVWSSVPYILIGGIVFLLQLIFVGPDFILNVEFAINDLWIAVFGGLVGMLAVIYRLVLFYLGYYQAGRFSSHWATIAASILGLAVFMLPALCVVALVRVG